MDHAIRREAAQHLGQEVGIALGQAVEPAQVLVGDVRLAVRIPQDGGERLPESLLAETPQRHLAEAAGLGLRAPPRGERFAAGRLECLRHPGRRRPGEGDQEEPLAAGHAQQVGRHIQGERVGPLQVVELEDERGPAAQGDEAGGDGGRRPGRQGSGLGGRDRQRLGRRRVVARREELARQSDAEARLHRVPEIGRPVQGESGLEEVEEDRRRSHAAPAIVEEPGIQTDGALPAGPRLEMPCELGLADPGLAEDEERRALAGEGPAVFGAEGFHLGVAAGELVEVEVPLVALDRRQGRRRGGRALDRSDEPVAAAVPGLDEPALLRRIVQGAPDLRHGFLEHSVGHVGLRPDLVEKLLLADDMACLADEMAQDADGAGLQGDDGGAPEEQIDTGEDPERAEAEGFRSDGGRGNRDIQSELGGRGLHDGNVPFTLRCVESAEPGT